jgi:hypothetical protein
MSYLLILGLRECVGRIHRTAMEVMYLNLSDREESGEPSAMAVVKHRDICAFITPVTAWAAPLRLQPIGIPTQLTTMITLKWRK